jgi:Xaa-Pro aminopeptidase
MTMTVPEAPQRAGSAYEEFPGGEYEARWRQAREAMAQARLDALLLTSEANYRYFSGHYSGFWVSKGRPMLMLLPREQEPVLVLTNNQVGLAERMSPVREVRAVDGFVPETIPALAQAIRDRGLARGRIGAELGLKQRLGLPVSEFVRLQALLAEAAFVDAADLLWSLRMIKSPAEVAYLRESIRIACEAYQATFETVRSGMTEREAHRTFLVELMKRGAERPGYTPVTSGRGNYHFRAGGPTDRRLEPGDLLCFDGGCTYVGYWSDVSRVVAVGACTPEQATAYRQVRDITHACLEEVKPGRPIAAIAARAAAEFARRRLPFWRATSRIGHGIGLDITEPPSIRDDVQDPLRPGLVLSIEPRIVAEHGLYQMEELYLVTDAGHELLTHPTPVELPVAG